MTGGDHESIEQRVQREITQAQYDGVRSTFLHHCERELAGDIDAVLTTLTTDCVYEHPQSGQRWEGHEGARAFYTAFLGAFPDNAWEIHDVVIGPQGVMSNATMTAHQQEPFLGVDQVGQAVTWRLNNMFPWDPDAQLFSGETLYFFRPESEYFSGRTR